ncbi:hypothetical protein ACEK07_64475 [Alcanivoracaceae bacterium MT1]
MTKENILTGNDIPVLIGAAQLMEDVFKSGLYRELKTATNKLETIKETIRHQIESGDTRRYELPNNVIAKFVPFPIYNTDEVGLKEYLYDLGILPHTTTLTKKSFKEEPNLLDELIPYQYPTEYFAQFYLNKLGKLHIDKEDYSYSNDLHELSLHFLEQSTILDNRKRLYENIMLKIKNCPFLLQSKVLKSSYGTCKLREKETRYDTHSICLEYGVDFLMNYGQVSFQSVENFSTMGYFNLSEIRQFRKLIDIQLRFVVMDKEKDIKQSEYFQHQLMRKAQLLRYA